MPPFNEPTPGTNRLAEILLLRSQNQHTVFVLVMLMAMTTLSWLVFVEHATPLHELQSQPDGTKTLHYTVDLNTAPVTELEYLPGVGETLSQRIIEYREQVGPFESAADLEKIKGIGTKKRASAEPFVTVGKFERP